MKHSSSYFTITQIVKSKKLQEKYSQIPLMSINIKILNNILASQFYQHMKRTMHNDQVGFIQECNSSSSGNQSTSFIILRNFKKLKIKEQMISMDTEKIVWLNFTSFTKNSQQTRIKVNFFNLIKRHLKKAIIN